MNNPKRLELEFAEAMKPFIGRLFPESYTGFPLLLVSATLITADAAGIGLKFLWIEPAGSQRIVSASYSTIIELVSILTEMLEGEFRNDFSS